MPHPFSILVDDRLAVFFEECTILWIGQELDHWFRRAAKTLADLVFALAKYLSGNLDSMKRFMWRQASRRW